jgi:GNAT superfamily N-acetyltransferase
LIKIIRTNSENKDFINLVQQLDAYLKITDGDEHNFYNQFNNINVLQHVVVVYKKNIPVGCGAFKEFNAVTTEIKRMFVSKEFRGKGFAKILLLDLENWSKELGYQKCILETGKRQVEAVKFYKKCNYKQIPNYGQYQEMDNSICFEKHL